MEPFQHRFVLTIAASEVPTGLYGILLYWIQEMTVHEKHAARAGGFCYYFMNTRNPHLYELATALRLKVLTFIQ